MPTTTTERLAGRGEHEYPPIAREGWSIIAWFFVGTTAASLLGAWLLGDWGEWVGAGVGGVGLALTGWAAWFFRDPKRRPPLEKGAVVSGADGVVCFVGAGTPPVELGLEPAATAGMTRVSVFMNVFNVHVNRAPADGEVRSVAYRAGKFFNASFDKASEHNERCSLALRLEDGRTMVVTQIAGLVARRIVCRARVGQRLATGERFGLIRFGSRVDVYLPAGVAPLVEVGRKTVAGETLIARLGAKPGEVVNQR